MHASLVCLKLLVVVSDGFILILLGYFHFDFHFASFSFISYIPVDGLFVCLNSISRFLTFVIESHA